MIKNVTDFNVVDSMRRDIKVLVTKTRYTVPIKVALIQHKLLTFLNVILLATVSDNGDNMKIKMAKFVM